MKKAIATFCLVGSTLALAACDTTGTGDVETAVPYTMERTASYEHKAPTPAPAPVAPAEKVFHKAQMK